MKSLNQLKKEIARERSRLEKQREYAKTINERKRLQRELTMLKSPTKRKLANLGSNLKRNTKYISKSLWGQIKTQAQLIKEQNERERKKLKKLKKTNPSSVNPIQNLVDF